MPWPYTFPFLFENARLQSGAGVVLPTGSAHLKSGKKVGLGALTPTGTTEIHRKFIVTLQTGVLTFVGTLTKSHRRFMVVGGSLTPSSILKHGKVSKILGGVLTPSGAIIRKTSKRVGGVLTPSSTVARVRTRFRIVGQGAVAMASTIGRGVKRTLTGNLTPSGTVIRYTKRKVGLGSITPTSTITRIWIRCRTVGQGAITPFSSISRKMFKLLTGNLTPTAWGLPTGFPVLIWDTYFQFLNLTPSCVTQLTITSSIVPRFTMTSTITAR